MAKEIIHKGIRIIQLDILVCTLLTNIFIVCQSRQNALKEVFPSFVLIVFSNNAEMLNDGQILSNQTSF